MTTHVAIRQRVKESLCQSCAKPIVDDNYYTVPSSKNNKEYRYHNTAQQCASAEPLKKDWYRQNDKTTKAHYGTKARLQNGDGHSWDGDDDLPVWQ